MRFEKLKKLGFIVLSFESRRPLPKGAVGMTDYLIIGNRKRGDIHFVERKYKGDRFRLNQIAVRIRLQEVSNYYILTEDNENDIIEKILKYS